MNTLNKIQSTLGKSLMIICLLTLSFYVKAEVTYSTQLKGEELQIGNLLEWGTSVEANSKTFIVEKSLNGIDFDNIGTVEAAGDSEEEMSYRYLDIDKLEELAFYRLKQLDSDGNYAYSQTVKMKKKMANQFMVVAMSKTSTDKLFDVTLEAWAEGELSYSLVSYKGEVIFESTQWLSFGLNELQINLENEKEGIYKLNFKLGTEEEKLVIEKRELKANKQNVASKN